MTITLGSGLGVGVGNGVCVGVGGHGPGSVVEGGDGSVAEVGVGGSWVDSGMGGYCVGCGGKSPTLYESRNPLSGVMGPESNDTTTKREAGTTKTLGVLIGPVF